MGKMSNRHALVFLWIVVLLAAGRLQAALWTGGGDNLSWSDPANWEAAGVPEAGAAVTNAAGAILLANATAELASFTMTGGTLTFTNWTTCLRATNVVLDGGIVTLPPPFTETQMSNRVWIACTDFNLAEGAVIDADAKGYQGLNGPGKGEGVDTHSSGGGHGGRGGRGSYNKKPGLVYDDMAAPLFPGSGGGVKFKTEPTAHGGGVIRIDAVGLVTVDGTITADGLMTPKDHRDGGGSGGAIWISSQRFGGAETGRISARGGNGGTFGGGGGGGRIAIHYQQLSEPARMRLSAARGDNNYDVNLIDTKEPFACTDGTIWLSDARLLTVPLLSGTFDRGVVWVPGFTEWAQESLVVSNASLAIGNPGMAITITNDLRIESGELRVGAGDERAELSIGGNLVLTNSGSLAVVSGTNTVDGYGACLGVAGDLLLASGSWIRPYSHPTEGGSVRMTARNLMIAAGGGINADNRGFHGQQGPGTGVNVWHDAGGSYGGRGELGTAGNASKPVYGSIDAPDQPGSGGGHGGSSGAQGGGAGGGLIRLELTGDAVVDGSLTANGGVYGGSADGCGSGSGGGIFVSCQSFGGAASGLLSVKGGDNTGARGGAGGGGRIAVDYETLAPGNAVRFNAQSGSGYFTQPRRAAAPGTLWLATPDLLQAGTIGDGRFMGVCFHAPAFDAWTVDELVVTNSAVILAADGFTLNVLGDLTVGDGGLLGIGAVSGDAHPALHCDGSLRVRDGGCLLVFGGRTNSAAKAVGAEVTVAGDLQVVSNGRIMPLSHELTEGGGGSPRFRAQNLTIDATGAFIAQGAGYRFMNGPSPGKTWTRSGRGGGGGHGGTGGDHSYAANTGGLTNDLALAPHLPGSGAGWAAGGGDGGGMIWLDIAGTASIDGTLDADGFHYAGSGGGGAGGTILAAARAFEVAGSAVIRACGGSGRAGEAGGGGGGRIAFWRDVSPDARTALMTGASAVRGILAQDEPFEGLLATPLVAGGATGYQAGQPGTIRFVDGRPRGTVLMLR